MAEKTAQTYQNHARLIPLYHYVALPVLLINALWALYQLTQGVVGESAIALAVAVALLLIAFYARVFALAAQDRIIRLEEQLRLRALLPDDLQARINGHTTEQLIGLRFASDGELPALARKVLDNDIADRKTIKQMVQSWRPDYQRV
jgi:hypothetical protein